MANWLVDSTDLDDPQGRWFVEWSTTVPAPTSRRVSQLVLPEMDGAFTVRQGWNEGTVKLSLAVTNKAATVDANAELLVGLLSRARTVSRFVNGVARTATVVDAKVSAPTRVSALSVWLVEVIFTVQPWWIEAGGVQSPAAVVIPAMVTFTPWAGRTGDIPDGIIRIKGPLTKLQITNPVDNSGVQVETTLTASQYLFIDVPGFRAWRGAATDWVPTANRVPLDWPAAGRLRLTPSPTGLILEVTGEGMTAVSNLTVRGSRSWV